MANIYVSCQGSRGSVHRLGGSYGRTIAATYQGAVEVTLYRKTKGKGKKAVDTYCARIELIKWGSSYGNGVAAVLYDGPVNDPKAAKLYPGLKSWKAKA